MVSMHKNEYQEHAMKIEQKVFTRLGWGFGVLHCSEIGTVSTGLVRDLERNEQYEKGKRIKSSWLLGPVFAKIS